MVIPQSTYVQKEGGAFAGRYVHGTATPHDVGNKVQYMPCVVPGLKRCRAVQIKRMRRL